MRSGSGRSELDELQEEVARRARQQEQQKRREAEREAAMGFNPKPSKFMDLDQLQHQGMEERGARKKTGSRSEGGWRRNVWQVFKESQRRQLTQLTENRLSHLPLVVSSYADGVILRYSSLYLTQLMGTECNF